MGMGRTGLIIGGIAAAALPVGYITYKHVQWEKHPQGKKRMLTRQLSFWAMMALGVLVVHNTFRAQMKAWKKAVNFLAAGTLMASAFELSGQIGRAIFPYSPEKIIEKTADKATDKASDKMVTPLPPVVMAPSPVTPTQWQYMPVANPFMPQQTGQKYLQYGAGNQPYQNWLQSL